MIILHENLLSEAKNVAKVIKEVYGIESKLEKRNINGLLEHIPKFDGYLWSTYDEVVKSLKTEGKATLILTERDLYTNKENKDDNWVFGYCSENIVILSNARMKRPDSNPSKKLEIPRDLYQRRLNALSIHEVGHNVVNADHFLYAWWVNAKTGYKQPLGTHCTDNSCVMYEIVDIKTPPKNEGYLQLGTEKRYDAGLDDLLERLNPNWLCDKCRSSIEINETYK